MPRPSASYLARPLAAASRTITPAAVGASPATAPAAARRSKASSAWAAAVLSAVTATSLVVGSASVAAAPLPAHHQLPATSPLVGLATGARGDEVKAVQQALLDRGITVAGGADGIFGPATRAAVVAFQQREGLSASGTVDQATAVALGLIDAPAVTTSSGVLARGASGAAVERLQRGLIAGGVYLPRGVDGVFGAGTERAVRDFQRFNRLTVTGTVTEATQFWIDVVLRREGDDGVTNSGGSSEPSAEDDKPAAGSQWVGLKYGSLGNSVRTLQERLIALGISLRGGADGVYGTVTVAAIRGFQERNGLDVNGRVDAATASAIATSSTSSSSSGSGSTSGSSSGSGTSESSGTNATDPYIGLQIGSRGDAVRELQNALLGHGFVLRGGADGVFGARTTYVLKVFQRINGLGQTGVVGAREKQLLKLGTGAVNNIAGNSGPPGYAEFGERGDRVLALQKALIAAGITVRGGADGRFGGGTAAAVMEFQRVQGLNQTGVVNDSTAGRLGLSKLPAPVANTASVSFNVFPLQGHCGFADTWRAPRGGGRYHEGTDIIAAEGAPLLAVVDGEITTIFWDFPGSLGGNGLILMQPNGTYFVYLHLLGFADGIEVGAKVSAGDVIGYNGNTGNSATPHLHFEIHPGGGAGVNPYPYLKSFGYCTG